MRPRESKRRASAMLAFPVRNPIAREPASTPLLYAGDVHPTARMACVALVLVGCSDEGGSAGPNGGAGGSAGGTGGGGAGAGAGGSAGSGGASGSVACESSAPSITRVGPTFEVPTLATTTTKRNPDVVFDPVHDVYLVVTGAEVISGAFVDADGQIVGSPFAVAETTAYTQTPRVTRGAGRLLVAWHDNRGDPAPQVHARLLSFNGTTPDLQSPDFNVSAGSQSYQEMAPALAYSETSKLFLIAWHALPDNDIRARRVDANGSLVGTEIQLSADADWQSGAAAAWSSARDEFLVTWTHAGAGDAAVRSRRIRASDGTLVDSEIELGSAASGTWTSQVTYLPCDDEYVAAWVTGENTYALRMDSMGAPIGSPLAFPSGYGFPEGFAMAQEPLLGALAAVMHGPTDEDFAIAFSPSGEQTAMLQATEQPGDLGHFNPRIAPNPSRNEWLLVTSHGFTTIAAQRLAR